MSEKAEISPHIKGKYELVGITPGRVYLGKTAETVNFQDISLKKADQLYAQGCPFLKKVEEKPSSGAKKD